jgi:hypothetical protein
MYQQAKAWPSRRIHLFNGGEFSVCGSVETVQCFSVNRVEFDFETIKKIHPYDNLNYCQSCLRAVMAQNNEKYKPIKQYYNEEYGIM